MPKEKEASVHFIDCEIKNYRTIYLDDEAWAEFLAVLENPPAPCPKLKALLSEHDGIGSQYGPG
jgi:uncharacterized protein (DUF1778 family)